MTDHKLLKLAAKAAGKIAGKHIAIRGGLLMANDLYWNPLVDDGDALRLAVKLGMVVQSICHDAYDKLYAAVWVYDDDAVEVCSIRQVYTNDPYAATRRAIVRAAAEIGRTRNDY